MAHPHRRPQPRPQPRTTKQPRATPPPHPPPQTAPPPPSHQMHAGLTVSLRTVAPPRRGEHVLGEGALGTERGRRPGADVARRLFRYRGETVDRMPTARLSSWGGRTRTSNFPVNSRAVCQLTYTPMLPSLPPQSAAFAKRIRSTPLLD